MWSLTFSLHFHSRVHNPHVCRFIIFLYHEVDHIYNPIDMLNHCRCAGFLLLRLRHLVRRLILHQLPYATVQHSTTILCIILSEQAASGARTDLTWPLTLMTLMRTIVRRDALHHVQHRLSHFTPLSYLIQLFLIEHSYNYPVQKLMCM